MGVAVRGCLVPGCTEKHKGLGFCARHYKQFCRNGLNVETRAICKVDECTEPCKACGYCDAHFREFLKRQRAAAKGGQAMEAKMSEAVRYAASLLDDAYCVYTVEEAWRRACAAGGLSLSSPVPAELERFYSWGKQ